MWDKSLHSDPLYFYYPQDGIRVGLLRTGYTARVGPTRCLRPGTGGRRKHHHACCSHLGESHLQVNALHLSLQLSGKEPLGYGGAEENASSAAHPAWFCRAATPGPKALTEVTAENQRSFSSHVHFYDLKSKVSHNPKDRDFLVDLFSNSISQWKQLLQSSTARGRTSLAGWEEEVLVCKGTRRCCSPTCKVRGC